MKLEFKETELDTVLKFNDGNWNVAVVGFGYLHDVGFDIVVSSIDNRVSEIAQGWDTLESDIEKAQAHRLAMWELCNNDFGYANKKF